jgi:hypothetical protein
MADTIREQTIRLDADETIEMVLKLSKAMREEATLDALVARLKENGLTTLTLAEYERFVAIEKAARALLDSSGPAQLNYFSTEAGDALRVALGDR